jgi:hypothetical protein
MRIPQTAPGNAQLTTTTPSAQQSQTVGVGKGLEALGGAVEKTTNYLYQKMDEARNFAEASKAELYVAQKMGELELKASTDVVVGPDGKPKRRTGSPDDFKPYDDELRKTKSEASKFFTNKEQADKFSFEYDKSALLTRNRIQNTFMKNLINEGQATTQDWANRLAEHYALSGSEKALENIEKIYDNAVVKGFFDADVGENKKKLALKDARSKLFIHDLEVNPKLADERLKSNFYKFEVDEMEKARAHYTRELNLIKNTNEEAVLDDYLNGGLTIDRVKALRDEKKIDANFALEMIGKIKNGNSNKTNPIVYMEAVDTLMSPDMTGKEKRDYLLGLLNSQQLSDSDFKSLYETGRSGGASVATLYMAEKMTEEEMLANASKTPSDMSWLRSAVGTIKNAAPILGPVNVASTVMKLFDSVKSEGLKGNSITEKAKSILRDFVVSQYPQVGLMKDLPNKIYDGKNIQNIYSGDNELTPSKKFSADNKDLDMGDTVGVGGVEYRVVGFDSDGEPLVESE